MLGPAFPVGRGGEETANEMLVGVGGRVVQKCPELTRSGRKTGEIEGEPTQESSPIGLGCEGEVPFPESGADKTIDGVAL
jgi:hypothetical protein